MSAPGETFFHVLPFWISTSPLLVGFYLVLFRGPKRPGFHHRVAVAVTGLNLLALIYLFTFVKGGTVEYHLPWIMGFGWSWRVDLVGMLFALLGGTLWFLATLYAGTYMEHGQRQPRFYTALLLSLGGCMGVFLAGDLFTLYPFFELMALSSWLLVVHEQNESAFHAGDVYLYMSIIGGLSLLGATLFLESALGHTRFVPGAFQLQQAGLSPYVLALMFAVGFGIKGGMIPLHIWLPKAHPVAPSPGSALLSAVMIKAGAYGLLRVLTTIFAGSSYGLAIGPILAVLGGLTMFLGAVMGIGGRSLKGVLAYSSISQIGYILFGLGVMASLGSRGGVAFAGAMLHVLNHGLYKGALFMLAGSIYLQRGELALNKLGGLARPMFYTMLFFLLTAGAITGVPGLNGYTSKTLLHHGVEEAIHLLDTPLFYYLEKLFNVVSGLTVVYISKLVICIFFRPGHHDRVQEASRDHLGIFALLTGLMLFIGLFPHIILEHLIVPAGAGLGFDPADLEHVLHTNFWDSHSLLGAGQALALGAFCYLLLVRWSLINYLPSWLSIEALVYRPLLMILGWPFRWAERRERGTRGSWLPVVWDGLRNRWMSLRQIPLGIIGQLPPVDLSQLSMENMVYQPLARLVASSASNLAWVGARLNRGLKTGLDGVARLSQSLFCPLPTERWWSWLLIQVDEGRRLWEEVKGTLIEILRAWITWGCKKRRDCQNFVVKLSRGHFFAPHRSKILRTLDALEDKDTVFDILTGVLLLFILFYIFRAF
ncbi:MAG: complex I subunit 5 family protein [Limnochordia bacterium]|jgi:hydrogenase-4 component B